MKDNEMIKTPWFFNIEEIFEKLKTNKEGLEEEEAKKRLEKYGYNNFKDKKNLNILKLFLKQLLSPLIFILLVATILTGFLNEWLNMSIIIIAILINTILGFYREYKAENTLNKLESYVKERCRVIRGGMEEEIDASLLVPGDIIKLSYGSRVPADARLISVNNLKIDEAILTGESIPQTKNTDILQESIQLGDRSNMAYAGTLVVLGFGIAIVINTAKQTEIGKIADLVSNTKRAKTPIQKALSQLSWYIFIVVVFIVTLIFLIGISKGQEIFDMMVLSVAVAVGAVPEALPIALTVILSIGAERIASKKGIIRQLSAAETLGSATLVMTDKTGTLTKADMQLVGIHDFGNIIKDFKDEIKMEHFSHEQKKILSNSLMNIDVLIENPKDNEKDWKFTGNPFEINILKSAILHKVIDKDNFIKENFLHIPFNSSNKFSVSKKGDLYIIMGAPDILLKKSSVDKEDYLKISKWIEEASESGRRLIAIATLHSKHKKITEEDIKDISFEGVLSFFDPIREDVVSAMDNIKMHGVNVIMITGDLKGTALSVAKSLNWEVSKDEVLTGEDIRQMTDEELLSLIQKIKVFARVTPEDKLRVANLYRQLGEVVAMTGDGVNDAPALKSVDIGISLGTASDVAQSSSDLVLLDDNFQTISMAIDEGRRILANIRKVFVYLMSNSLDMVFLIGGSLLTGLAMPLNALQIIWINLFTGSLPALSFAYDKDLDKDSSKKRKKKKILNFEVKILSFIIGTVTSSFLFLLYYILLNKGIELNTTRSILFVCVSVYILALPFSLRSLYKPIYSYNPFSNKKLNVAIIISFLLLLTTVSIPFARNIFSLEKIPANYIWIILLWAFFTVFLVEVTKFIFRIRFKIINKYSK